MTEENCSNNRLGFKVEFRVTRFRFTQCVIDWTGHLTFRKCTDSQSLQNCLKHPISNFDLHTYRVNKPEVNIFHEMLILQYFGVHENAKLRWYFERAIPNFYNVLIIVSLWVDSSSKVQIIGLWKFVTNFKKLTL